MADTGRLPGRDVPAVSASTSTKEITMNPARRFSTRPSRVVVLAAAAVVALAATACDDTTAEPSATASTSIPVPAATVDVGADASALSDDEVAGLLWMREEEQLAHDVYVVLGESWGLRIFENIAASESTHIEAVSDLLDRYGIDDPAEGNAPGTYTNPAIQELYDELVADGSVSLEAALEVGALIEELDISDLQARTAGTDVDEITTVYAALERGSRNHLRAFTSQLESRGVAYEPTRLDPAIFDAIVSSEMERGRDG
jgi:hypothetical protein